MDLSPLNKFLNKLNKISSDELIDDIHLGAYSRFYETVIGTYPSAMVTTKGTKGKRVLTVTKHGLWFVEYGTGTMGNGTFPDPQELPTETITFNSVVSSGQTQGWVYNYDWENYWSKDKDVIDGYVTQPAWRWGTHWEYGQIAKAGVWLASKDLGNHLIDITRTKLWGDDAK